MAAAGRIIQIFLPSGEPRGIRVAEFTTRIVQAIAFPRSRLSEAYERSELRSVGVYFLFGRDDEGRRERVYVGESEDCGERLWQHGQQTEFWQSAVAIVSRTQSFNKAHARWLEFKGIALAQLAGRYELANGNAGIEPKIPEAMRAECDEVFETMDLLLGLLGHPVFEALAEPSGSKEHLFFCQRAGADARGVYTEDGLVVLAGSTIRVDMVPSAREWLPAKRQKLLQEGVLEQNGDTIRFARDHAFGTPSAASDMVVGAASNGWDEWKDGQGRTLDAVFRKAEPG